MKFLRCLAIAAAAAGSMFVVGSPAKAATTATVLPFAGSITHGSGFNSGNTVTMNGQGLCAEGNSTPNAGGRLCILGVSGFGKGNCASWSATVSGSISTQLSLTGPAPAYSLNLKLTASNNVVTITGTAGSSAGTKQVTGYAYTGLTNFCYPTGPNYFTTTGELTIAG